MMLQARQHEAEIEHRRGIEKTEQLILAKNVLVHQMQEKMDQSEEARMQYEMEKKQVNDIVSKISAEDQK